MAHASNPKLFQCRRDHLAVPRRASVLSDGWAGWSVYGWAPSCCCRLWAASLVDSRKLPSPLEDDDLNTIAYEIANGHLAVARRRDAGAHSGELLPGHGRSAPPSAFFMGRVASADRFLDSWLIFFLDLPALIVILLSCIWLGLPQPLPWPARRREQDYPECRCRLREAA